MNKSINTLLLSIFLISPFFVSAQSLDNIFRSSGRIYVVIAVILIILFGLFLYLIRIERKINKLNKEKDN
jgi:hypothetical protein